MNYKMGIVSVIVVFLVGCSASFSVGGSKQQDAIIKFINEDVEEASQHQETSALLFNELLMDPEVTEEEMVERIKNEVIPEAEKAVEVVEKIDVSIEELEEPYELLKDGIHLYTNALNEFLEWVETNDPAVETQVDQTFDEYQTALEKYHHVMEELADEFEVEYERHELPIE